MEEHTAVTPADDDGIGLLDVGGVLARNLRLLLLGPLVVGLAAFGATYLVAPTFTATTTFLPPQQPQSATASALASLGALSGLVGAGAGALRSPGEQYVALMQSASVTDRVIDQFKLREVYGVKYRFEAREELARNVRISLGKRDGLISVQVDDKDAVRAAEIANRHVDELRRVTSELALTEAQQRRAFFGEQLQQTQGKLIAAQKALEGSGFSAGALRAEPRAAAEAYARLKAELTSAEVRLQTLRRGLSDDTPEVQQQLALVTALRAQLGRLEATSDRPPPGDYVGKYREYKYQETLFELFSKQYELARLDESREGALIQVVDVASVPEWKSKPKRATAALLGYFGMLAGLIVFFVARLRWQRSLADPRTAEKWRALRLALGR